MGGLQAKASGLSLSEAIPIDCGTLPFYVYGYSERDIVRAEANESRLKARGIVERAVTQPIAPSRPNKPPKNSSTRIGFL
jgi:hypothetical protein